MRRRSPLRAAPFAGVACSALALVVLAVLTAGAAPVAAAKKRCAGKPAAFNGELRAIHAQTLCLINRQRKARGLRPLRHRKPLATAARRHAKDMVRRRFFAHTAPGNLTFDRRIRSAGYRGPAIGENLAWGSGSLARPAKIVAGWMRSAGHRANILSRRYRAIGVGIVRGTPSGRGGMTYTTTFGSR